jgi:hypothetical protein
MDLWEAFFGVVGRGNFDRYKWFVVDHILRLTCVLFTMNIVVLKLSRSFFLSADVK